MTGRIFLLSPANCSGRRARMLLSPEAQSDLAIRLQTPAGVPLGEVFTYVSSLYFRGKLTYATRFALPPRRAGAVAGNGIHVITPSAGLWRPDAAVTTEVIRAFAASDINAANASYRRPLEESARALLEDVGNCEVVLLGSIASPKYVDVLLGVFGGQLRFPEAFVGRGDMSRGGLLLRQVAAGEELAYVPVVGAVRRGSRPPRLEPQRASAGVGRARGRS